jgi:hypothetical protein
MADGKVRIAGTKVYQFCVQPSPPMVFAEDIRKTILKIADERGTENTFGPSDVAQRVDGENWQSLMDQVWFVASVLEKEGKIKTTMSGGQIDFQKLDAKPGMKKSA